MIVHVTVYFKEPVSLTVLNIFAQPFKIRLGCHCFHLVIHLTKVLFKKREREND